MPDYRSLRTAPGRALLAMLVLAAVPAASGAALAQDVAGEAVPATPPLATYADLVHLAEEAALVALVEVRASR